MPPYPRSYPRRYPNDMSLNDYDLRIYSEYDPLDDIEQEGRQNAVRDIFKMRRPRMGEMSMDEMIHAYDSDTYDSDSNNTPYRRRQRKNYRSSRSRSRSQSRRRNKSDQGRTEHHHHHHVMIYSPTTNSNNNNDPNLYTPRNQQMQQLQSPCRVGGYPNRQAITSGPAFGPRCNLGMGMGAGAGVNPRGLSPAMQLQLAQNQCTFCCCMTARSHQGDCSLTGPMNTSVFPRQFGQQRLLQ